MKTKLTHRHLHPVHWHGSMYVAIAAILLSALKTSGDMVKFLEQAPVQANMLSSVFLRDAENLHLSAVLESGVRNASYSGE